MALRRVNFSLGWHQSIRCLELYLSYNCFNSFRNNLCKFVLYKCIKDFWQNNKISLYTLSEIGAKLYSILSEFIYDLRQNNTLSEIALCLSEYLNIQIFTTLFLHLLSNSGQQALQTVCKCQHIAYLGKSFYYLIISSHILLFLIISYHIILFLIISHYIIL